MVSYLGYLLTQSMDCPIVSTSYMYGITVLNNKSLMRRGTWGEIPEALTALFPLSLKLWRASSWL